MNKKDMFIAMVEDGIEALKTHECMEFDTTIYADALAYFEAFKSAADKKEKPQFTDNGKLILKTMIDNVDDKQNMFKARDIAELAFISSRSVSGAIRKLVNDGYVSKIGQDPIIYELTDLGRSIVIE